MTKKRWWWILMLTGLIATLVNVGWHYQMELKKSEVEKIANKVGRLMMLPNEYPTLATVTDAERLAGDNFFVNAKNGDKVLIYRQTGKAILYRPQIDKIIDIALVAKEAGTNNNPSSTNAELTQFSTEVVDDQPLRLALYNGTSTSGATTKMENQIKKQFPSFEVVQKDLATNDNYQQTIIVDISGKYKDSVGDLGEFLGAKMSALPSGEVTPEADILIILGNDANYK